jgi:hypothetical protein
VVLRKLMKLLVGNSERLVGMVAEFDADKGYLIEKEVVKGFLPFGQPKEEKPKAAYEEIGSEKGIIGEALKKYNTTGYSGKVLEGADFSSKLGVKAGTTAYQKVAGQEASTKEKKVIDLMGKINKEPEEVRGKNMKGGGTEEPRSKMDIAKKVGQKGVGALAGAAAGVVMTAVGAVLGSLSLVFLPITIAINVMVNTCIVTAYSGGKVAEYFSDLVDSSVYKSLGRLADTKRKECDEIVKMLAMNTHQKEDEQINQMLLSVLSNVYNAVDYIQKAEEKFRDKN